MASVPNDIRGAGASDASSSDSISAKEKRTNMIHEEMNKILEDAQDFLILHEIDEDLEDEAKDALRKAASKLAYRKQYYDVMEDNIVYFPTCQTLVMNYELMEEAEKYYYDEEDEFPPEYIKALRTVVSAATKDQEITTDDDGGGSDEKIGSELMNKLASSWREALGEDADES